MRDWLTDRTPLSPQDTYCNPLPLPDYPRGYLCRNNSGPDFRETADPTVLYHEGVWYLYSSCAMAYKSTDFVNWEHIPLQPEDIGYAPTVVAHNGKFYLAASGNSELWEADSPEGPFRLIGHFTSVEGGEMGPLDPMLFSDEGHLYLYWGGGSPLYGAELDMTRPGQLLTHGVELMKFDPAHRWECLGQWNEDTTHSFIEGAWMFREGDEYYLTYCAPGTEFDTYAMGAYRGKSPLGPFEYQRNNPFLSKRYGLVRGPGHGSIVRGPANTLWAFYTCTICFTHMFERRIGMDPLGIDENGDLYVREATEIPRWAPGLRADAADDNATGLLPFTFRRPIAASSMAPGRDPLYATDDSMLSFWQPAADDPQPWLTVSTAARFMGYSARIVWREVGLDYENGVVPGPVRYVIEVSEDGERWTTVLDAADNDRDMTVDYRPLTVVVPATKFRLRILGAPRGITPAVINFTVFGICEGPARK